MRAGARVGAGGGWQTIDERADASVPRQSDPLACVAATGEMLARSHKLRDVSQADILAKIGTLADPRDLAPVLAELGSPVEHVWRGVITEPTREMFDRLGRRGAWGTTLREGHPLGHFVLVEGVDARGRVQIKDPFPLAPDAEHGTSYVMDFDEFARVWSGEVVLNDVF